MTYTEVNLDIIHALKAQGFTSVQLVLRDPVNPSQALVELIPGKQTDFELDVIALDSREIHAYTNGDSPMTKYVVNQDYLVNISTGKSY